MTPQELFTKAYLGVVMQGEISYNPVIGRCYYRHPEKPLCCAVGHLLDDATAKRLENIGSVTAIWQRAMLLDLPDWFVPNIALLKDMQVAHDDGRSLAQFQHRMAIIAEEHDFNVPDIPGPVDAG